MARISLDPSRTLLNRALAAYSRRRYGRALDPLAAVSHDPRVATTYGALELGAARWRTLDPTCAALAVMAVAVEIGCSWCVDFGFWESEHGELGSDTVDKLRDVPHWRDSDAWTHLERNVLEYAQAATATPPTVSDALAAELLCDLGEAAFVELTALVALENFRSRTNAALGLTSQGFSATCAVPPTDGTSTASPSGRMGG